MGRRETVRGTTAPALLGGATESRGHAARLADVRAATWTWRSSTPDDERPARQQREIRRQLGRDRAPTARCDQRRRLVRDDHDRALGVVEHAAADGSEPQAWEATATAAAHDK